MPKTDKGKVEINGAKPITSCSSLLLTVMILAVTSRGGLKPTSSAKVRRSFHHRAPLKHSPTHTHTKKHIMIFLHISVMGLRSNLTYTPHKTL